MKSFVEKYFWPKPNPITYDNVEPAPGDPEKESEMKSILKELTDAAILSANRSIALKKRLAVETIEIVTRGPK